MTRLYDAIGRLVTWLAWGPVDRTVCYWANLTHDGSDQ